MILHRNAPHLLPGLSIGLSLFAGLASCDAPKKQTETPSSDTRQHTGKDLRSAGAQTEGTKGNRKIEDVAQTPSIAREQSELLPVLQRDGIEGIRTLLDRMGPGSKRNQLIRQMIYDASLVNPPLTSEQLNNFFKLIDQSEFPEDRKGLSGLSMNQLAKRYPVDEMISLVGQMSSPELKGALSYSVGRMLADTPSKDSFVMVGGMSEADQKNVMSSFGDSMDSKSPAEFENVLNKMAVSGDGAALAMDSYVNSIRQYQGEDLISLANQVVSRELGDRMVVEGFARWFKEDSLRSTEALSKNASTMSDPVYDQAVSKLVNHLMKTKDTSGATQWANSIRNPQLKQSTLKALQRADPN